MSKSIRLAVIATFINLVPGSRFQPPGGEERTLNAQDRVTPPGTLITDDPAQADRLIRAQAVAAPDGYTPAQTPAKAATGDGGNAVSHARVVQGRKSGKAARGAGGRKPGRAAAQPDAGANGAGSPNADGANGAGGGDGTKSFGDGSPPDPQGEGSPS